MHVINAYINPMCGTRMAKKDAQQHFRRLTMRPLAAAVHKTANTFMEKVHAPLQPCTR
jgi:hypothetical protein